MIVVTFAAPRVLQGLDAAKDEFVLIKVPRGFDVSALADVQVDLDASPWAGQVRSHEEEFRIRRGQADAASRMVPFVKSPEGSGAVVCDVPIRGVLELIRFDAGVEDSKVRSRVLREIGAKKERVQPKRKTPLMPTLLPGSDALNCVLDFDDDAKAEGKGVVSVPGKRRRDEKSSEEVVVSKDEKKTQKKSKKKEKKKKKGSEKSKFAK